MPKRNANDWRIGTKRHLIAELADRGLTKREAFAELRPLTESGVKPMVFSANVGGRREPKPMAEQLIELKNEIGRVYAILGRATSSDFDSDEIEIDSSEDLQIDEDETKDSDEEDSRPRAKGKTRIEDSLREFLREARRIRQFCIDRAARSDAIDSISMRPFQAAARLIPAGVPVAALIDAMTMHWPKDVRQDAGIRDFDFVKFSAQVMRERGIDGTKFHRLFGYVLILAECRQPIMLVGPFGTGKSHLAKQVAEYLGLPYGETPMTPGATRGDLLGRHTAGGFIASEFNELYGKGGVFNFEEIDASDPSMLIVLNNALASDRLYNSSSGEMVERHENFVAVSTANTFGLGANREFTGRERLDAATIDRWRMGRVYVALDEEIEEKILFSRI